MRLSDPIRYAGAVITLLVAPLLVVGQQPGENLRGLIVDLMNARVARAKILIVSGSQKREVLSDEMGEFSVEVPAGAYQITIASPGFRVAKLRKIRVQSGRVKEIRVVMQVIPVKYGKCPKGQICLWL